MRVRAEITNTTETISHCRHICGWCRRDLGALWLGSQEHSYAICESCKQTYFASLYEPAVIALAELEQEAA
jgi:hypothetical protein